MWISPALLVNHREGAESELGGGSKRRRNCIREKCWLTHLEGLRAWRESGDGGEKAARTMMVLREGENGKDCIMARNCPSPIRDHPPCSRTSKKRANII